MNIIGATACPSGVAHTYIAAEALEKAFKKAGHNVNIETQGSIGIENELTKEQIRNADYVILTTDISIKNEERFKGKPIVRVSITDVIKKSDAIVKKLEQHYASKHK